MFTVAALRHRYCLGLLLLAVLASATAPVAAVEVKDLYSAEVAIDPDDPKSREMAEERALQQVLVRVTGSEAAAVSPELMALFPNPRNYVLQFRPLPDNGLWIALDGAAIERVLRSRGLPVWSNERPLTMVWLVVDWGRGQREMLLADGDSPGRAFDPQARARDELRKRLSRVATARGLPYRLPTAAELEQAGISLSDVWGGFHDPLLAAARNMDIASVLVGRARPGDAERSRWSYYSGSQRQQWNGDVEDAFHLLADTLAGEFVISGNAQLAVIELTVSNVGSATAYASLQKMMDSLQVIDDFRIRAVSGNQVRYAVRINGGARRLAIALNFRSELTPLADDPETGLPLDASSLHYALRP
jgi:hypothetical protein